MRALLILTKHGGEGEVAITSKMPRYNLNLPQLKVQSSVLSFKSNIERFHSCCFNRDYLHHNACKIRSKTVFYLFSTAHVFNQLTLLLNYICLTL